MLSHLRIQNFKGWQDTGDIQLSPLTLFFGSNSSGKSSIGQFLMMLKQTIDSSDRKAVFYPGAKNSAVQLGSFQEMVLHHDTSRKIIFEYAWSLQKKINLKDINSERIYEGDNILFSAEAGLAEKDKNNLSLNNFSYSLCYGDKKELAITLSKKADSSSLYEITCEKYELVKQKGRVWNLHSPGKFYAFPDEVVVYYKNADFVQDLNLYHEQLFRSMFYLGPLRTKTERLYTWGRIEPESVGYDGQNAIAAILSAKERKINYKYRSPTRSFQIVIMEELKKMGLIEDFEVKEISSQRQEYEVKIKTKGSSDLVDLPDVGFGISQVLPVLVQCFYAPPGSIILIEQPEIHLHPSAQSALADVMIDVINSGENGNPRNIQLIIETHSEHFLRRLQRRIVEDDSLNGKISAYFADITKSPAVLEKLQIDLFGNILNWPKNFFGDIVGDVFSQDKTALEKQIKMKKRAE
ncbi:AAA family ATPase [Breznakiellaceae bacterium SP9]